MNRIRSMLPIIMVLIVMVLSCLANWHISSARGENQLDYILAVTILLPGGIVGRLLYDRLGYDFESAMKGSVLVVNAILSIGIAVIWYRRRLRTRIDILRRTSRGDRLDIGKDMTKKRVALVTMLALVTLLAVAAIYLPKIVARSREVTCLNNLTTIQSAIYAVAMDENWTVTNRVNAAWIQQQLGGHFPECPSGGEYIMPETLGAGQPICSVHGNLLKTFKRPR